MPAVTLGQLVYTLCVPALRLFAAANFIKIHLIALCLLDI